MCFLTASIAKFLLVSHICIYRIERLRIVGIIEETIFSKGYDIVLEIGLNTFKKILTRCGSGVTGALSV